MRPNYRLHHIGQLVADLSVAQSLIARFGYVIESDAIHDVHQTAIVQFLRQPGMPFWLELIRPDGEHSKLTQSLKKGITLHHICYEVTNIEIACAQLMEQEMIIVDHPVMAQAFPNRRIAWLMDRQRLLVELLEHGTGSLTTSKIT